MSNRRREDSLAGWVPKTELGKLVLDGQISSIFEIFEEGLKIKEVQIVDALVPDLKDDVININLVQKQTDAGESSRFTALVAVGNSTASSALASARQSVSGTLSRRALGWQS